MPATQTTTLRDAGFFKRLPMLLLITLIGLLVGVLTVWGTPSYSNSRTTHQAASR